MKISMVLAVSENRVIGRDNGLPWHLPDDFAHFKDLTLNKPVIMGRKTFKSIGRPLPKRRNIVLTRDTGYRRDGVEVASSPDQALALVTDQPEVMVIGGAQVYEMFLALADTIYLTVVHATVEGDTYLPELDLAVWRRISAEDHPADERHAYAFTFETWERRDRRKSEIRSTKLETNTK